MSDTQKHTKPNVPNLRFPGFEGEWNVSSIGNEFELYSGNTPSRLDKNNFMGEINWITSGELKNHYIGDTKEKISENSAVINNLKLLPEGTFVIAIYGLEADGVRATGSITTKRSTISQACMAFIPKGKISNEFLYSWYKKHGNLIGIKYAQGTKQQNLSYDIIERLQIRYPSSQEQEKLNSFISLIDARISIQNKVIEKYESLIKALSRRLIPDEGDDYAALETLVHICKGEQLNGECLSDNGKYYVMNGGITPSGYYDDYNTLAGTISISEGGNSCGFVQFNEMPFWSGGHCYTLLQTSDERIQYKFLYHFLKSKQDDIMSLRIGSGLPNIQKKDLGRYPVPILSHDSQTAITRLLDVVCQYIKNERAILNDLTVQKQYVLQAMFI